MSHKGMVGYMGPTSNEHLSVLKLIGVWNEVGELSGYIYSEDKPMPDCLKKISDAIQSTREYLKQNPPKVTLSEFQVCKSYKNKLASETHNCPYHSDIENDDKYICNCCSDCTEECNRAI